MKHSVTYSAKGIGACVDLRGVRTLRDEVVERFRTTNINESYNVEYENKETTFDELDDFLGFLAVTRPEDTRIHMMNPKWDQELSFRVYPDRVIVEAKMPEASAAIELCGAVERIFALEQARESVAGTREVEVAGTREVEVAGERTVFLAHSFDEKGSRIASIVERFLALLDFDVATGREYTSKRISEKVKQRIKGRAILVSILTARPEEAADEKFRPSEWLIQEASLAEGLDKPLFLLIEEGVKFDPGIHGDIEYIRFSEATLAEALIKLLEGFRELGYEFSEEW